MLAALLILFAAAIPTTLAAEVQTFISGASVPCGSATGNGSTGPTKIMRVCGLQLSVSTSTEAFYKECTNRDLQAMATDCPQAGGVTVSDSGVTFDRGLSPECWVKQCSVVPEYLSCFRAIYRGNNTEYHAGAYQLMEDCSLLGYDVTADVGNLRSSAMVIGVPATAVILGAAAVCAFM